MAEVTANSQQAAATQDGEVTLNWLFFDASQPNDNAFLINIPRSLLAQDGRDLFVTALSREFGFEANRNTVKFWKPNDLLLGTVVVDSQPGWTESISGRFHASFSGIPFFSRFTEVLTDLDNPQAVHLVVTAEPKREKRPAADQGDPYKKWKKSRMCARIPSPEELRAVLERPLADSEKIPIREEVYNSLLSDFFPDICTEDDIHTLFKIGEQSFTTSRFLVPTVANPPPSGGTEYSFVSFWDSNIRWIVELLVPEGETIRNSNHHTETKQLRPDLGFIMNQICVFRGEEKGPDSKEDPAAELVDKLSNWAYNPAPYMLGYYCSGPQITLTAICAPGQGGRPSLHDIVSVDLRLRRNRIANVLHLINLSALFHSLVDLVPSGVCDYAVLDRERSKIEVMNTRVIKTFKGTNAAAKVRHLEGIYRLLEDRSVPNTDSLVFARGEMAVLSPRGILSKPRVEKELQQCLICVLGALVVAHKVKLYHRDIRWENILRTVEDTSKWFLIDWEDASTPPTQAQPLFDAETHSPAIFLDGHGPEVDIWAIGYLIKTSGVLNLSSKFKRLGEHVCSESHALGVHEVLTLVTAIE